MVILVAMYVNLPCNNLWHSLYPFTAWWTSSEILSDDDFKLLKFPENHFSPVHKFILDALNLKGWDIVSDPPNLYGNMYPAFLVVHGVRPTKLLSKDSGTVSYLLVEDQILVASSLFSTRPRGLPQSISHHHWSLIVEDKSYPNPLPLLTSRRARW